MIGKTAIAGLLYGWLSVCFALPDVVGSPRQTVRTVSSGDMLHWSLGLLIVLGIFFFCVWGLRKLNGVVVNGPEKMRVVGGLSLGMREKVILLQVGKKQLVLGVTPGRIDTLHVLEGDDCLDSTGPTPIGKGKFNDIIMQVMKGRRDG
jgi:flagellar protein FliO/FliZ